MSIDREEIKDKVLGIVSEQLGLELDDLVKKGDVLDIKFADLKADSLDLAEMVLALEEEFNFEISESEAESFTTIGKVVSFLADREK